MTWDEIRATYPPDTWLLLEVTNERWDRDCALYDPARVLDAGPPDRLRNAKWERARTTGNSRDLLVASTAWDRLEIEASFNGLVRVDDAEDEGLAPMRVIALQPSWNHGRVASSGRGHGGGSHDPEPR